MKALPSLMMIILFMLFAPSLQAKKQPCKLEIKLFCKVHVSNPTALEQCLKQNHRQLSYACKSRLKLGIHKLNYGNNQPRLPQWMEVFGPCQKEAADYCSQYFNNHAAMNTCLKERPHQLSKGCRRHLSE